MCQEGARRLKAPQGGIRKIYGHEKLSKRVSRGREAPQGVRLRIRVTLP